MLRLIDNRNHTDPRLNLALEEYALRNFPTDDSYLLLYVNAPSIVLGKHQNVLEEVDRDFVDDRGIRIIRRISGGGTVYHDLGNLNFSFITRYSSQRFNNYREFTRPIIAALRSCGVPAELNSRNDIVAEGLKISGNAQFTSRGRMLSHGTLLFNSELDVLEKALHVRAGDIRSKSTKSVRSRVANISDFLQEPLTMDAFIGLVTQAIFDSAKDIPRFEADNDAWDAVERLAHDKYDSWEWNFGRSPRFSLCRPLPADALEIRLEVSQGLIAGVEMISARQNTELEEYMRSILLGVRFEKPAVVAALKRAEFETTEAVFDRDDLVNALF